MPFLFFLGAWNTCFAKVSSDLVMESTIDDELSIIKVNIHVEGKEKTTQSDSLSAAEAARAV